MEQEYMEQEYMDKQDSEVPHSDRVSVLDNKDLDNLGYRAKPDL